MIRKSGHKSSSNTPGEQSPVPVLPKDNKRTLSNHETKRKRTIIVSRKKSDNISPVMSARCICPHKDCKAEVHNN